MTASAVVTSDPFDSSERITDPIIDRLEQNEANMMHLNGQPLCLLFSVWRNSWAEIVE
jgi:hypothetical protein|tara:strand:- start:381 stop:554 length:174 start_codon:yes stop_codon:yes gene_type:complete